MEWLVLVLVLWVIIFGVLIWLGGSRKRGRQNNTPPRPLEESGVRNQGTQPRPPVRVERERHPH